MSDVRTKKEMDDIAKDFFPDMILSEDDFMTRGSKNAAAAHDDIHDEIHRHVHISTIRNWKIEIDDLRADADADNLRADADPERRRRHKMARRSQWGENDPALRKINSALLAVDRLAPRWKSQSFTAQNKGTLMSEDAANLENLLWGIFPYLKSYYDLMPPYGTPSRNRERIMVMAHRKKISSMESMKELEDRLKTVDTKLSLIKYIIKYALYRHHNVSSHTTGMFVSKLLRVYNHEIEDLSDSVNTRLQECSANQYRHKMLCKDCPRQSDVSPIGSVGIRACMPCKTNFYSDPKGEGCLACPKGLISPSGSIRKDNCRKPSILKIISNLNIKK